MRSNGSAVLLDKGKSIRLKLSPMALMRLKRIFVGIQQFDSKPVVSLNGESCEDLEWFFSRYPVTISEETRKLIERKARESRVLKEQIQKILQAEKGVQPANLAIPLRDYQKQVVSLVLASGSVLNGDVLGLGKTATGIGVITYRSCRPAVIVCQTHVQKQWVREIKKFSPSLSPHIVRRTKEYDLPGDVFIITYAKLAAWAYRFAAMGVKSIVYDECQELRRHESLKHQAAIFLADKCKFRLGLSATPIYNYGGEIFNVVSCIRPGCLGTRQEFMTEWCSGSDMVQDPQLLGRHLRDMGVFVRRDRKDVSRELPSETRIVVDVGYDEAVMKRNDMKNQELARTILTGAFTERGQAAREFDLKLRQATGVAKAIYVAEYVKELVAGGEKVLLCGWHREVYEIWRQKFELDWEIPFWLYTGSESPNQKDIAANGFSRSERGVMAMSLRSGAGLDGLQESCSIIGFGELDWSGKVHDQCVGRLRRDGQKKPVTSIFFVADAGSDPVVSTILGIKDEQSRGIVDLGKADVMDRQNQTGRITALARQFLSSR